IRGAGYRMLGSAREEAPTGSAGEEAPPGSTSEEAPTGSTRMLGVFAVLVTGIGLFVVVGEWLGLIYGLVEGIPAVVAVPAILIAGWPRLAGVLRALSHGRVISHALMSAAMVAALIVGEWATALVLVLFMHVGAYAEKLVADKSRDALKSLAENAPRVARVIDEHGRETHLAADEVSEGALVRVSAGEMIPVDGVVVSGNGAVVQAAITGESFPLDAGEGDELYAASTLKEGGLTLRTLRSGGGSMFGRIVELVAEAESARGPTARVADRFSAWYLPVVLAIAAATFVIGGELMPAIAVLAVACSCSFALATPIAMLASIASAAGDGLLIRSGEVIERSRHVDTVLFDKTGTLTRGEMAFSSMKLIGPFDAETTLSLAAGAEAYSEHPLARALREEAQSRGIRAAAPEGFSSTPGGVSASVAGRQVRVGGRRYLGLDDDAVDRLHGRAEQVAACDRPHAARIPAFLEVDGEIAAVLYFSDPLRDEAAEAIAGLREAGVGRIEMITGDDYDRASIIASELGIEVRAGLLPHEKLERIAELQDAGHSVMMVGDGMNDAPALARADVGVALGRLEAAVEAAPVVLMRADLRLVAGYITRVRRTMRVVFGNIGFTSLYNLLGISLAAVGILPPVLAAALQSAPDVGVLANSSRLARRTG
ncbi:MAG: heavy metal translocating P-type ATPase, partial [Spirochaetales bacterium]